MKSFSYTIFLIILGASIGYLCGHNLKMTNDVDMSTAHAQLDSLQLSYDSLKMKDIKLDSVKRKQDSIISALNDSLLQNKSNYDKKVSDIDTIPIDGQIKLLTNNLSSFVCD